MGINGDWKLKKIELEFKTYGKYEGKYVGSVQFQNGELESFRFNIRPEMADAYIKLISGDIVVSASNLGDRLLVSLGLDKK